MMPFRAQVEMLFDQLGQFFVGNLAGTEGRDHDAGGLRHADRVGHLDLAFAGQAGGHDVLGDIARGIGGRAVDLGGILAGKRAAAVRRSAAVGVDDDLAPGQAAVALGAADDECAGGVDQVLDRCRSFAWAGPA